MKFPLKFKLNIEAALVLGSKHQLDIGKYLGHFSKVYLSCTR